MPICDQCGKNFSDLKRHQRSHEMSCIEKTFAKGKVLQSALKLAYGIQKVTL
jgi:predicted transcriptional regulator